MTKLNCKPGDMAVVIAGAKGAQIGKVVTCIRLLEEHESTSAVHLGATWLIDSELWWKGLFGAHLKPWCPDCCLMPIQSGIGRVVTRTALIT